MSTIKSTTITPKSSTKCYNTFAEKRKRRSPKVKTETYIEERKKKRQKATNNNKIAPSSSDKSTKSRPTSNTSKTKTVTPTKPIAQSSSCSIEQHANGPNQASIKSYLSTSTTTTKQSKLKVEEYFKLPDPSKGFNLPSLRRHFLTTTLKPNIVTIIKKTVQHNNVIPWRPAPKKSTAPRSSSRIQANNISIIDAKKKVVPSVHASSSVSSSTFNPDPSVHRCYLEDFISLPVGSNITILLPIKECSKAKKVAPSFDIKFVKLVEEFDFERTCIGEESNAFYVINATIKASPNRNQALSGIDRQSLQEGLYGNKKFGCIVSVLDSDIYPLVMWRDVLNGRRKGLQVSMKLFLH
jgi:hypothetical protein